MFTTNNLTNSNTHSCVCTKIKHSFIQTHNCWMHLRLNNNECEYFAFEMQRERLKLIKVHWRTVHGARVLMLNPSRCACKRRQFHAQIVCEMLNECICIIVPTVLLLLPISIMAFVLFGWVHFERST